MDRRSGVKWISWNVRRRRLERSSRFVVNYGRRRTKLTESVAGCIQACIGKSVRCITSCSRIEELIEAPHVSSIQYIWPSQTATSLISSSRVRGSRGILQSDSLSDGVFFLIWLSACIPTQSSYHHGAGESSERPSARDSLCPRGLIYAGVFHADRNSSGAQVCKRGHYQGSDARESGSQSAKGSISWAEEWSVVL